MKLSHSKFKRIPAAGAARRLAAPVAAVLVLMMCAVTAFAVEGEESADGYGYNNEYNYSDYTEAQVQTEYVAPETQAQQVYTEPVYTEAQVQTEYVAPATEYVAPTTQAPQQQATEQQQQQQYANTATEAAVQTTAAVETPTIAKTVSDKKYSTNYAAGVVSWICVGVGVLTVIVVMASTKLGARRR